jgi:hypothetical protein
METAQFLTLNENEVKLLDALRQEERRWPRWRWASLGIGLVFASLAVLGAHAMWSHFSAIADQQNEAVVGMLWNLLWVSQGWIAFVCVAYVFKRHPANARRRLLLKLADSSSGSARR